MKTSYLCPPCSQNYDTLSTCREWLGSGSFTGHDHVQKHGKHFTGWQSSAMNGVLQNNAPEHYEYLMRTAGKSGFFEIEADPVHPELWGGFNLYHLFQEPQADMQIYGSGIGLSPLFKVVDIKRMGNQHGFGVTGCKKVKGECLDCEIPLFDYSSGPPLVGY